MKTKVIEITETRKVTEYGCDFCEFSSDDETKTRRHINEHVVSKTKYVMENTFYYIENRQHFDIWIDNCCYLYSNKANPPNNSQSGFFHYSGPSPSSVYKGQEQWVGTGWYYINKDQKCTCCSSHFDLYLNFLPAELAIIEMRQKISKISKSIEDFLNDK